MLERKDSSSLFIYLFILKIAFQLKKVQEIIKADFQRTVHLLKFKIL
jgi:hypothetical protein